ncbi:MAG: hypothetical protein COV44_11535 [Deltaproteobacteria bacterium CG11_big_fil_rev_8_21_14_0_20_45_16]|nr:MAG: hypothetical protein COV44_11535 [Deltaproteobacteria bacterium CG11_big_fil_rev_8_21_14_0_20_45_16]
MDHGPERLLFCDYDGEFRFADVLSRLGFLVDQIRPEGLRSISVGEHSLYIFSFEESKNSQKALKTCEKLKSAQFLTPIVLVNRNKPTPDFINHKHEEKRADAYVFNCESESPLLDVVDGILGTPLPPEMKLSTGSFRSPDPEFLEKIKNYEDQVSSLNKELEDLRQASSVMDKALEAQRNFYKPKLKALLDGQKVQLQTETERLKFKLSEIEAKLLDREARIKELEQVKNNNERKIDKIVASHQKAQQNLRVFYQEKIRQLGDSAKKALEIPAALEPELDSN